MDLSVIVLNYNTKDKLRMTLQSVFGSQTDYQFEVTVVDNASTDGSAEMVKSEFSQARLIQNQENIGFAKGNNIGIRQASGRYILLLNSDVEIHQQTFDTILKFMDNNQDVGIAGCKVVLPDGRLDKACRRSFPDPVNAFYRLTGLSLLFPKSRQIARYNLGFLPEDEIAEVDSVMGAFMLVRREVIDQIGALDENFFMYGEDLDYCFRAKHAPQQGSAAGLASWKVMYVPLTQVVHHKGSSSRRAYKKSLYEFHRAMAIFYDKHYRAKYNRVFSSLVHLGIWVRYYLKLIENFFRVDKYVSR